MTPGRRPPAARLPRRAGWLAAGFAASAGLHAAALAALLLWPGSGPEEEPGEGASVALVFADTAALAGGGEAAPPEAPAAPPAPPAVSPPADPAAIPPPPVPERLAALAPPVLPPASPPPPDATRAAAVPPPIPTLPPVPITAPEPAPDPAPVPPPADAPASRTAEAAPPVPPPAEAPARQAAAPPADPLPIPPPFEARPVALAALPERAAAPPPRPAAPRAPAEPVRLGAGAGALPDPSLGARATGAVVPPGAADGFRNAPPDYPADSRRRGEEGVVRLSLSIGVDGRVAQASVAASSGHAALDAAAISAARRWRFRPATQAGLPVAATLATAVHFRLTEGERR